VQVQTVVDGQVNLIVAEGGLPVAFWDGTDTAGNNLVDGGTQTWNNAQGNWTNSNGSINQAWIPGMAIFTGAAGTVTLGEDVDVMAMQFSTDGYQIATGNTITLIGMPGGDPSVIRVDPGSTATIAAEIAGSSALVKEDSGTLILSGANTYSGGTILNTGTLSISSDSSLGNAAGGITFDSATLQTTADLTLTRAVTLNAAGGVIQATGGTTLTVETGLTGAGGLTKTGTGTLLLAGNSTYMGTTSLNSGTIVVNGMLSSTTLNAASGTTLGGAVILRGPSRWQTAPSYPQAPCQEQLEH
jgi:fibronectin-binding autotransporter adhesin